MRIRSKKEVRIIPMETFVADTGMGRKIVSKPIDKSVKIEDTYPSLLGRWFGKRITSRKV